MGTTSGEMDKHTLGKAHPHHTIITLHPFQNSSQLALEHIPISDLIKSRMEKYASTCDIGNSTYTGYIYESRGRQKQSNTDSLESTIGAKGRPGGGSRLVEDGLRVNWGFIYGGRFEGR